MSVLMKGRKKSKCARSMRGSQIVEALLALMLTIGATTLAVILLLNTGSATYDKEKIAFVANQAATYATSLIDMSSRDSDVQSFVDTMFTQMGVKATNTVVTVKDTKCAKWSALTVQVTTTMPTIMSSAFSNLIPQQIQVTDTAVAIKSPYAEAYCIGVDPLGGQVTLALINPDGTLPSDGVPAWAISLAAGVVRLR